MRSISNSCSQKRQIDCAKKEKQECHNCHSENILYVVGIGPGHIEHISQKCAKIIESVDIIIGYTSYVDLIRTMITEKQSIISLGMRKEKERANIAIETVLKGKSCAVISSGDPGIYAMAGLIFEMCSENKIEILPVGAKQADNKKAIQVEVIPGIPALCSGASLLGAPLMHDFATISLSDLLTLWNIIEDRIEAAAKADFVIVIYNPKSKKRVEHIIKAQQIIMKYRDGNTPVGIVRSAMRENQQVSITLLKNLHKAKIDMQTTVFIGNSKTKNYCDFMVTPRGYSDKYNLKSNQ